MLGEKAYSLVKELEDRQCEILPYNTDLVTEIATEIVHLYDQNHQDVRLEDSRTPGTSTNLMPTVRMRHAAIQRNQRCLLAYHYNRLRLLRQMRWEFGSILPTELKENLSAAENGWFNKYSTILGKYMRSIGENGGLNLAVDLKPPKALFIEVRCLVDYGKLELNDGTNVLLKKNSQHFLPRSECEELIRRGILQHIAN
ncbi:DNA replication complex GINS protein PSF1-like [Agrilus planipennis]|uniref:DNA replication complex GINS protein PSF1 n=1 Tax=Agrilus planipennis TaxID=224129 RepID=A0A1W4XNY5_AGRPL|nr:DNA replication complex GINS protein PSF1-like [Agrilus planipennis]